MPFAEIVLYAFESEKVAALSGAISLLFAVGTIANILWSLYFFGYRWPALALFVSVIDVVCNIFSFGFVVSATGSNWVGWIFYIYTGLYVLIQALVIWPISLAALRSDGAWGGCLPAKEDDGTTYMASPSPGTCTCLLSGVFVCAVLFAALLVGIVGAVTRADPIVFAVVAPATVGVVALLLGVSASMSMSSVNLAMADTPGAHQRADEGVKTPGNGSKQENPVAGSFRGHHDRP
jgi:hypothetical protein